MHDGEKIKTRRSVNRSSILQLLTERDEALRHKDICAWLEGMCDRVTIYRALDRLITEKEVIRFIGPNGCTYFGISNKKLGGSKSYIYCMCRTCDRMLRFESHLPILSLPPSFIADEIIHIAEGACIDCV